MGFGLIMTLGKAMTPAPATVFQWLTEARVEMDLSKATMFALRFEDDICEGKREIADANIFQKDTLVGLFVINHADEKLECLVYGPVTKIRSSSLLGGPGSWVEVHGEDRRALLGRKGVRGTYSGKASATVQAILKLYEFESDVQDTLIEYNKQTTQLTQNGTDLAFVEDLARRNNMDFWIDYEVKKENPIELKETAKFRTSPERSQKEPDAPLVPKVPLLVPDGNKELRVNPPDQCPNVNTFDTRINFEKPASTSGFAMDGTKDKQIVEQMVKEAAVPPIDPKKDTPAQVGTGTRDILAPPESTKEELFLAQEAIVFEQSWFIEVDCSATLEQLGFVVRPHQIVKVANAGDPLSGGYQVMKATHVVTPTDHFTDFTIRANGLGGFDKTAGAP